MLRSTNPRAAHGMNRESYWWYLDLRRYGGVAARRLRPGLRADDDVPHRHEEHPRRDPVPADSGQRGVLDLTQRHRGTEKTLFMSISVSLCLCVHGKPLADAPLPHRGHRRAARSRPGPPGSRYGTLGRARRQSQCARRVTRICRRGPRQRARRAGRGRARRPPARQVSAADRRHLPAPRRVRRGDARRRRHPARAGRRPLGRGRHRQRRLALLPRSASKPSA